MVLLNGYQDKSLSFNSRTYNYNNRSKISTIKQESKWFIFLLILVDIT